jgi:hypothetical protein
MNTLRCSIRKAEIMVARRKWLGYLLAISFVVVQNHINIVPNAHAQGAGAPQSPNSEQVRQLVVAAWKQRPDSMDITYYKTFKDLTKDKQEFEHIFQDAFDQMYGPRETLSPAKAKYQERMVQLNVERSLKEKEVGRKSKIRIRYEKDRQRIDYVGGTPARTIFKGTERERIDHGKRLDANTPYTTSVIEVTDQNNVSTRYEYLHKSKIVNIKRIKTRGSSHLINEISEFSMMPVGVAGFLRKKLSDSTGEGSLEPNEIKINRLRLGTLKGIGITIEPDNATLHEAVRIEMILYSAKDVPVIQVALICDRDDYSRVYSSESRIPASGALIRKETRDNFDFQGFPHKVSVFEYDATGKNTRQELYEVESVFLNTQIPSEDFELSSAKDYRVIAYEKAPEEKQAEEIARFKGWLEDEDWTRRVRALAGLKEHLRENPLELRDIATSMLKDKNPQVRKTANWILKSLE